MIQFVKGTPLTESEQADALSNMREIAYELAYRKNSNGLRYEVSDEMAIVFTHIRYAIDKLKESRCMDVEGHVSHDLIGDHCRKCGSSV